MTATNPSSHVTTSICLVAIKVNAGFQIILSISDDKVSRESELLLRGHDTGNLCLRRLNFIGGATRHFDRLFTGLRKLKALHCFVKLAIVFPEATRLERAVFGTNNVEVRNGWVVACLLTVDGCTAVTYEN